MSDKEKAYFIGDNKDEKSARIAGEFYLPGEEIPVDKVAPERLADWVKRGIVSIGSNNAPIIVNDTGTIKGLDAEIRDLKAKLDAMPGLEKQNAELKKSLEKAKDGAKAKNLKALEDDVKEKGALIEKHAARITELEAEVEALTEPVPADDTDTGGNDSGGPS